VTQVNAMKRFYLTFIYGANQEGQRRLLWEALTAIANDMEEAWYILGDFNSVLHPGDRLGGTDIQAVEIKPFEECINTCEIQELRSVGPYFTWTNKTIWTRIDRVFINALWYDQFDFSQVIDMANSLSDHTAMVIDTPSYPRPPLSFYFCCMWTRDTDYMPLVTS